MYHKNIFTHQLYFCCCKSYTYVLTLRRHSTSNSYMMTRDDAYKISLSFCTRGGRASEFAKWSDILFASSRCQSCNWFILWLPYIFSRLLMILKQQHVTFWTRRVCGIQVNEFQIRYFFWKHTTWSLAIAGHQLFALHSKTMDGFDGDDFQLSQAVAEYEVRSWFGYLNDWCLEAFPELKREIEPQREETRFKKTCVNHRH